MNEDNNKLQLLASGRLTNGTTVTVGLVQEPFALSGFQLRVDDLMVMSVFEDDTALISQYRIQQQAAATQDGFYQISEAVKAQIEKESE